MTFRSRSCVASESAPPSFSTRERIRRTLSPVRVGHRLDLECQVVVLDLDPFDVGDLGKQAAALSSVRRVVSWALARI